MCFFKELIFPNSIEIKFIFTTNIYRLLKYRSYDDYKNINDRNTFPITKNIQFEGSTDMAFIMKACMFILQCQIYKYIWSRSYKLCLEIFFARTIK